MEFQLVKGFIGSIGVLGVLKQASTIETKTASPEKGPIRARPHITVGIYLVFFNGITLYLVKSCVEGKLASTIETETASPEKKVQFEQDPM